MRKILKYVGIIILIGLVVIQFIRPERNLGNSPTAFSKDISTIYPVSDSVQLILQQSCYDCHSNKTSYPWYANIQPVAWWLADHVNEGKRELNFSEFAGYSIRRQYRKLEEVNEQVKEGEMPLSSYTIIHKNAVLKDHQKLALANWAEGIREKMRTTYPPDSLIKKK
ncbi:MAG: heme-binding domain-containing protein [Ferruginibacter sp.]